MKGSLVYNGEKVILTPGTLKFPGGLEATLECKNVTAEAEFAVLKLKNTGREDTYQIAQPKTLDMHVDTGEIPRYHSLHGDSNGAESFLPLDFDSIIAFFSFKVINSYSLKPKFKIFIASIFLSVGDSAPITTHTNLIPSFFIVVVIQYPASLVQPVLIQKCESFKFSH